MYKDKKQDMYFEIKLIIFTFKLLKALIVVLKRIFHLYVHVLVWCTCLS